MYIKILLKICLVLDADKPQRDDVNISFDDDVGPSRDVDIGLGIDGM